ncbi:ATP synthase subunit a [Nymphaea thermarum]|nr:ATP synthase subunit a [Nymphaea thermarum]
MAVHGLAVPVQCLALDVAGQAGCTRRSVPLLIVLALSSSELRLAISQAHVSMFIVYIYLNDATNLHQRIDELNDFFL